LSLQRGFNYNLTPAEVLRGDRANRASGKAVELQCARLASGLSDMSCDARQSPTTAYKE